MARKKNPTDPSELRRSAEARLRTGSAVIPSSPQELELGRLVHELEVHRVELEMQNEELRRTRRETEAGLARYTALFDFAPIGYVTLGEDGTIREINHTGAKLLGRHRSGFIGKNFDTFVPAREELVYQNFIQAAFYSECTQSTEFELRGVVSHFMARLTAACVQEGGPMVLLAFEDISDQRKRERQLSDAERALREADRHKDEFLAALSHELRNPLAPIRSSLYLLTRTEPGGERAKRAHAVIERQVTHLTRLIDDLLDVTRIARGKILLQRERVDLANVVRQTLEDHRPDLERADLTLNVSLPPEACWVDADPARMVQVVSNVLGNAEKFTPRSGAIDVKLHRVDAAVELQVRDNGTGIPPELLQRLFVPFTQAPQTMERSQGGLGLGLAMVKGLVELHGGTVAIASAGLGCGTTLTVRLTAAEAPSHVQLEPEVSPRTHRRVLIIEDNVDAANSLLDLLTINGHDVRNAFDGPSGLALAKTFCPEVVLCDIGLPRMDGYEVAKAFRGDTQLGNVYLVALTGYALAEDTQRATDAGFDRHVPKPPSLDKLDRILSEAPEMKQPNPPSPPSSSLHSS